MYLLHSLISSDEGVEETDLPRNKMLLLIVKDIIEMTLTHNPPSHVRIATHQLPIINKINLLVRQTMQIYIICFLFVIYVHVCLV